MVLRAIVLTYLPARVSITYTLLHAQRGKEPAMAEKEMENTGIMHSVYFLDCDGRLIGQPVRVPHGQPAKPPAFAPAENREFLGWSRSTACVLQNVYCVAITRERTQPAAVKEPLCRVQVLELRGQRRASLFPLGNWERGETLTRDDLACLHLRRMESLRPFRCPVAGDILLVVTDYGVRAFDTAMRPLEGLLELMPVQQKYAPAPPVAGAAAMLAWEA